MSRLKLGLALGSGAAKGWAHIGVLRALAARGFEADIVAGSSVGSLVGAALATGQLDKLESWVRKLSRTDVLRLLDARFSGGVIQGNRLMAAIESLLSDGPIESLNPAFGAVATDMHLGREIWLRDGPLLAAVRASCALPLLFSPSRRGDRWLIDGGVVNPVPVSLCYAMGADIVIAVNLNAHHFVRVSRRRRQAAEQRDGAGKGHPYMYQVVQLLESWLSASASDEPGMIDVVGATIDIMQERITRSRLAGEPPHLEITPRIDLRLMEFHRADEAIAAGEQAVEASAAAVDELLQHASLRDPVL